jgi:DNA-binding transcriptional ArsR family regulator
MNDEPDISKVAALLGDATRARICLALCDGRPLPAGELALRACASAQAASNHLAKLRADGLVRVEATSRCRYYSLAGAEVARAIEALALVSPATPRSSASLSQANALRRARTCYDHLAGILAVGLAEAMVARRWLVISGANFEVLSEGVRRLATLGVDTTALRHARRAFALVCEDWSERRPHLAGSLGAALLERLVGLGWIRRQPRTRAVRLTPTGYHGLKDALGYPAQEWSEGD